MVHDIVVNKDMVDSISKHDYVLSFEFNPDVDDLRPHDYVRFIVGDYGKYLFGYMFTIPRGKPRGLWWQLLNKRLLLQPVSEATRHS